MDNYDLNKLIEDCIVKEQYHDFEGTNACAYSITTKEGLTVVGTHVELCEIDDWSSARSRAREDAMSQLRKIVYTVLNMQNLKKTSPDNLVDKVTELVSKSKTEL